MAITSVASSTVFPSVVASQAIGLLPPSNTAGTNEPAVINSVSGQTGPGAIVATASDIQSSVNGINAAIQNYARLDWSKFSGITREEIATAQSEEAQHLQAAEGACIRPKILGAANQFIW